MGHLLWQGCIFHATIRRVSRRRSSRAVSLYMWGHDHPRYECFASISSSQDLSQECVCCNHGWYIMQRTCSSEGWIFAAGWARKELVRIHSCPVRPRHARSNRTFHTTGTTRHNGSFCGGYSCVRNKILLGRPMMVCSCTKMSWPYMENGWSMLRVSSTSGCTPWPSPVTHSP